MHHPNWIDPKLPYSIFNPILHFFSMNSRETGLILRIHRQVANRFTPIYHLISEFEKNGVNSEHSCYKWIIPEVPICYLYPEFPFFFSEFGKKRGKIWEFILQIKRIPSYHIQSLTRFSIFFQRILEKRDKFYEFIRKWPTR